MQLRDIAQQASTAYAQPVLRLVDLPYTKWRLYLLLKNATVALDGLALILPNHRLATLRNFHLGKKQ
jgi:hypothetical protein